MENRHWTAVHHCYSEFVSRQIALGKHPPPQLDGLMLHLLHFILYVPKDPQHSYMWVLKDPATEGQKWGQHTLRQNMRLRCPSIGHRKKIAPTVPVLAGCHPEGHWWICEVSKRWKRPSVKSCTWVRVIQNLNTGLMSGLKAALHMGGLKTACDPATHIHFTKSQLCAGLYQKTLLCFTLWSAASTSGFPSIRQSEDSHKDGQTAGEPLLWGRAETAGIV